MLRHLINASTSTVPLAAARATTDVRSRTHGDGRLAGAGMAGDQDGAPGDLAVFDHLHDDAGGAPGQHLPDHALRDGPRLQRIVQSEAPNVRVRACNGGGRCSLRTFKASIDIYSVLDSGRASSAYFIQCSSWVGKRAGCKINWAQSSARTTKIRAQFSAQTTQNLLCVNDQNLVLRAIDENMGTNLQAFYKNFYIGCLKTQKQQLHFVKIKNIFFFFK